MRNEAIFPPREDPENLYKEQIAAIRKEIATRRRDRVAAEVKSFRTICEPALNAVPSEERNDMGIARGILLMEYGLTGSNLRKEEQIENSRSILTQSSAEAELFLGQLRKSEKGKLASTVKEALIWARTQADARRLWKEILQQR